MCARWLTRAGIDPRGFVALLRVMILMDLREQHWAQATATKPHHAISPLFLVVGQCLTASALTSALLFARVDVFFFALVNLSLSLLLMASAVVVEFREIALNPRDRGALGHLPVAPRTYAAARLANLLFYFALMYCALNVFPVIVGAGARDAGWAFAPAYVVVSLGASLFLVGALVFVLAVVEGSALAFLRLGLSWLQIAAVLVAFYGGQLVLRDGTARLQVWGAFPPDWLAHFPVTWLARLVEGAATRPSLALLPALAGCALAGIGGGVAALWRVERLCRRAGASERSATVAWPLLPHRYGSLSGYGSGWLCRGPEERAGFWLAVTFLRRDGGLTVRCLFAFSFALIPAAVGIAAGSFGDPCREADPAQTIFPLLTFFAVPLAAPALVYHLAYCRDSAGGWVLRVAPIIRPTALARGACTAALVWVVAPLCFVLAVGAGFAWRDPISGLLHGALAWGLTWAALRAALWLLPPRPPFSVPPVRGLSLRVPPLPVAAIGLVLSTLATVHALCAPFSAYWVAIFAALPALGAVLGRRADRAGTETRGAA